MTGFTHLPDLAGERFGGAVVAANDEFFAPKEALVKPGAPEWREGVYTERGKWMDGWETRRRRAPGHDWAVVRLGLPGVVRGVVIDTRFFTGNYPERASVDAAAVDGTPGAAWLAGDEVPWEPLLPDVALRGDAANPFAVDGGGRRVTHLRLNIFPDGGVARLRVHGVVVPDATLFRPGREVDLAAIEHGGAVIACSDMHYGDPQRLIYPGRSTHMGDGWETRRRRGPGHDWTIVRLARRGAVERVELDTDHFKGNAPGSCLLEWCDAGADASDASDASDAAGAEASGDGAFDADAAVWRVLVPETPLEPHARHRFDGLSAPSATHVRLNIYPDGGVARLRLFGRLT